MLSDREKHMEKAAEILEEVAKRLPRELKRQVDVWVVPRAGKLTETRIRVKVESSDGGGGADPVSLP